MRKKANRAVLQICYNYFPVMQHEQQFKNGRVALRIIIKAFKGDMFGASKASVDNGVCFYVKMWHNTEVKTEVRMADSFRNLKHREFRRTIYYNPRKEKRLQKAGVNLKCKWDSSA